MPDGTEVYRPFLNVTVWVRKKSVIYPATVDSGADNTILSHELVEALGAKWERMTDEREEWGAGGPFMTRWCRDASIYYDSVLISSGVRVAMANANIPPFFLLGRSDFFKKFTASFRWDEAPPWFEVDKAP
jgi:hypothetical protein